MKMNGVGHIFNIPVEYLVPVGILACIVFNLSLLNFGASLIFGLFLVDELSLFWIVKHFDVWIHFLHVVKIPKEFTFLNMDYEFAFCQLQIAKILALIGVSRCLH